MQLPGRRQLWPSRSHQCRILALEVVAVMGASPETVGAWVAQVAVEEVTEEDLAVESAEALVVALEAEVCRVMVEQMVEQVGTEAKEGGRVAEAAIVRGRSSACEEMWSGASEK